MKDKLVEDLKNHFMIKTSCIWIDTYEELRAIVDVYNALAECSKEMKYEYDIMEWSEAIGGFLMDPKTGRPIDNGEETNLDFNSTPLDNSNLVNETKIQANENVLFSLINACQHDDNPAHKKNYMKVFIIKEMSMLNDNPKLIRYVRDLKEHLSKNDVYTPIIMIAPSKNIPNSLQKLFVTLKCPLPDVDFIETEIIPRFALSRNIEITADDASMIAQAAAGLSSIEIKRAFDMSFHLYQKLDTDVIMKEKIDVIQKSGILTYKIPKLTLDDIGGHEKIKKWIREVKKCSTKEAIKFGINPARGYLSTGVAGSGKTALAEAVAHHFGYPLVILDLSKIMGGIVGESERNARMAFDVLDSVGKTVVLVDEAEKALGGIKSSNKSDGGTMARVFGVILEHMNDNKDQFYILTSNNVADLPPELSRSGRLDSKWFFWYPSLEERKQIFNIHFKKHNKTVSDDMLTYAAERTQNYTGAEIENSVNNIIRHAFLDMKDNNGDGNITNDNIVAGINEVTPVFKTSKAEIENMRSYAKKNHIPYTSYQESEIQKQEINKDDNIGDKNEGSFLDNCLFDM